MRALNGDEAFNEVKDLLKLNGLEAAIEVVLQCLLGGRSLQAVIFILVK